MPKQQADIRVNKAAALRYRADSDSAPIVVASGRGELADRIVAEAQEHDIAVYQDVGLVEALLSLNLGAEIPPELYRVVAEVLVFIRRLDLGSGRGGGNV